MREYGQLLEAASDARVFGFGCFAAAVLSGTAAFWEPQMRFGAVVLVMLAVHLMIGHFALKRMATMQAALDMEKIAVDARRSEPLVTQRLRMVLGDDYELRARDGTAFRLTPNCAVEMKVEYHG